jgi:hypothetical protein
MLVAFRSKHRAVFMYGFAKNERANIDADELKTLQDLATSWLGATEQQIEQAVRDERLDEVQNDE